MLMMMGSGLLITGLGYNQMPFQFRSFNMPLMAECQAGRDFTKYGSRVTTLNHIGVVKHLLSMLRDRETDTTTFRHYSDRIMRLLVEEALS
jgi:hypothetical protein